MIERAAGAGTTRARVLRELRELVEALDRRVPQVHRMGEAAIARSAAALREEALTRIETLERDAAAEPAALDVPSQQKAHR